MASNQQSNLFIKKKKTTQPLSKKTHNNNMRTRPGRLAEQRQVVAAKAAPTATNHSSKSDTPQTTPALSPASVSTTISSHLSPETPAFCEISVVALPATKKKRPVTVSDSKRPPITTFYGIAAPLTPSQLAAAAYRAQAEGVCTRWGWPDPSRLDREAKMRVKQEVTFLEQANSLMDSQLSVEGQLEQVELQRRKAQADKTTAKEITFINRQSELEEELDSIVGKMTTLDSKYKESYTKEKVWDCSVQVDLWERLAVTMKKREGKAPQLEKAQDKKMQRSKDDTTSAGTTMPKRSIGDNEKALQQAKRSRPTRASAVRSTRTAPPAAQQSRESSPSISPSRDPYSRKRKNPKTDRYDFAEDSEDEDNDKEFDEFSKQLEDKRQRLSDSDEPKPAPRQMQKPKQQRPASRISDEEKMEAEQRAEDVQKEERAKKRKLRKEIFPSGKEEAMNDEAAPSKGTSYNCNDSEYSTPIASGYGSTHTV